ncbi:MAG: oxidoreductase [Ignavibacteriae bacterium HGW-Ignavibacteriae-4]|jgi:3-oxoacyl-[acyl-carrier protein] reductase|nr:MAG: oxidoreductase [Ignavibacteriae bacterium HGW-Ignavibacteriae-4]
MSRILLITGSRKGIGRYLAEYYLKKDYLVIGFSRSESDLTHANYKHFLLDVADENAVSKSVRSIFKEYKRIDYLINNAGIASMNHFLLTPLSIVSKVFETNFKGTFNFSREVGKIMSRQKFGRIINFTTVARPLNLEGEAVYASSKSAVETFTRVMAKELGHLGITCNLIGPSPIKTDLIKNIPKNKIDDLIQMQAIPEFSEFKDVSNVTDFFLSDESEMITGQTIYLSGVN